MNTKERVNQIRILASKLSANEQEAFRKAMERQVMMKEAQRLSKGEVANISMEEIVREVNIVRKKRFEEGK